MFKGSMPALVTPMSNGKVDDKALKELVEWHIAEGTHGLVPVGTTGESPTLTHDEHQHVIRLVVKTAAGRIPVIAGAGSNNTAEAISLLQFAKDVGADAGLVVTPYYNKPTQAGLIAHYTALNDVGLPIIIYNIPGRSIVDITPKTMGVLSQLENIVGLKDATGDITRTSQHRITCAPDFIQLTGEDGSALGHSVHGGRGCISVTANVAPRLCAEFQNALLAGDYKTALEYQDRLMPLHEAIFMEPGLAGAKYGLSQLGRCENEMRLPMIAIDVATETAINAAMRHAGITN